MADPAAVAAIEELVRDGSDRDLCRINVLDFAARTGIDEERAIAAFLHAARLASSSSRGTCCARVAARLDASTTLKSVNQAEYHCAWCAAGYR